MSSERHEASVPLRLGVIGMSEGNGHPYSWSAIFNGFDPAEMAACPFPVIPRYLGERRYPEDFLGHLGHVSHVWTQDPTLSRHIASAARIEHVADSIEQLVASVDAVLLARDDAEHHRRHAAAAIAAGLPMYIDKPLATSVHEAEALLATQRYPGQIFSCSALRYAPELIVEPEHLDEVGSVRLVEATVPKRWETYAVHAIEPIVAAFASHWGCPWSIQSRSVMCVGDLRRLTLGLDGGILVSVTSTGSLAAPIGFRIFGERGSREYAFRDSFTAFRGSLAAFVDAASRRTVSIPPAQTLQIVACIEEGLRSARAS